MEIELVFEDEYLLIANKPSGIATQADEKDDGCSLVEQLAVSTPLFVVHRLDQRVSGVVILAKSKEIAARLSADFQSNKIQKYYRAMVAALPPDEHGTLTHWLVKDSKQKKSKVVKEATAKSQRADLNYRVVGKSERYALLEIELLTGRFHQIRAQLAAIGCPLVGDLKYGFKRSTPDGSIYLQAFRLSFTHPNTRQKVHLELPMPEGWKRYGFG